MKLGIKIALSVSIFSLLIYSCKRELQSPLEYINYVENEENGLKKSITVNGWCYDFQYKPHEYIILKEGGDLGFQGADRKKQLDKTVWFNVDISRVEKTINPLKYKMQTLQDYETRYQYMISQAAQDFTLVYNKTDTVYPISYLFETNYNLTPIETVVIGFKLPNDLQVAANDMQIIYRDRVFNNGIVKTLFTQKDITQLPKLTDIENGIQ